MIRQSVENGKFALIRQPRHILSTHRFRICCQFCQMDTNIVAAAVYRVDHKHLPIHNPGCMVRCAHSHQQKRIKEKTKRFHFTISITKCFCGWLQLVPEYLRFGCGVLFQCRCCGRCCCHRRLCRCDRCSCCCP